MEASAGASGNPDLTGFGPYRILSVLGEGGMGVVYLAEQERPVRRRLALKVIKRGMDTEQVLARFEVERQALAMMNHPHIAKVFDAATTDDGRPYFAMELVKGVPVTEYCDRNRLTLLQRIELFDQICRGVQHAHHKGVMHRDLKPSNILVSMQDGQPIVKIIDFGLARAMEQRLTDRSLLTEQGQIIGTPEYMSPEQAEMEAIDVDTRTDVYSLGVLLYELLTGVLPFSSVELRQAGVLEVRRKIREDEPPKPSTRIATRTGASESSARARATTAIALQSELKGDLDWIVMRALEKDRVRRYQTPTELAADLQRFVQHEPVSAGPPGTGYRIRKFVRRYRREVVLGGALVISLVGGLVFSIVMYLDARTQQRAAVTARGQAESSLANFDRLTDLVEFQKLATAEEVLWPEIPANAEPMRQWLVRADRLVAALPEHRATLQALRARAPEREPFRFDDDRDQFLHDGLASLVERFAAFAEPERGRIASVRRRIVRAREIVDQSIGKWEPAWRKAIEAIRVHPRYGGRVLTPQLGLIPLEPDPKSTLWEFAHWRGELPERDAKTGRWAIRESTALVFVLIPGGTFTMGAQSTDTDGPNYDPDALPNEAPPREGVRVEPFFLSKYEMTQARWLELAELAEHQNPAHWRPGATAPPGTTLVSPVESVSWNDCVRLLATQGFVLPTERQWEYACRADTTTPYWSGGRESLSQGSVLNVADKTAEHYNLPWPGVGEWEGDDGAPASTRVGTYDPNPFGLHEMHGNVHEWCADPYSDPFGGEPLRDSRVFRGGSYYRSVQDARSSRRNHQPPASVFNNFGVRPARAIE